MAFEKMNKQAVAAMAEEYNCRHKPSSKGALFTQFFQEPQKNKSDVQDNIHEDLYSEDVLPLLCFTAEEASDLGRPDLAVYLYSDN